MKKISLLLAILLVSVVMLQGLAMAESVSGTLKAVDATQKTLSISQMNAATGAEEDQTIWVSDTTTYAGVKALDELKAGQKVSIEAEKDAATGNWKAVSVKTEA